MAKDVTRREAIKAALKAGAYAAPVVLAAKAPLGVSAATPGPTADIGVSVVGPSNSLGSFDMFLVVLNSGPSAASGVVISFPVPGNVTFSAVLSATQGTYNPATGLWSVGNLPVNATATLNVLYVTGAARTVAFTATRVASTPADPNPANDTATDTFTFA